MLGMRIDIGIRNWLYRINIGIRNWLYRINIGIIKWWVEGNRKFKVIKVCRADWNYWSKDNVFLKKIIDTTSVKGTIEAAEKYYIKDWDTLKYIQKTDDYVYIGYWEGEPLRSEYRWRDTMTKKDWKRLDELFAIPLKERTKKEEVERDKLFDKTREI